MRFNRSQATTGLTLAVVFAAGVLSHTYWGFPNTQLISALRRVKLWMTPDDVLVADSVKGQLSRDDATAHPTKTLETALLPVDLKTIRISEQYSFPKTAGGVTVVNDAVVIVDRLGEVYVYEHD